MTMAFSRARGLAVAAGTGVVVAAAITAYARTSSLGEAAKALVAAVIAVAAGGLAVTLPGKTVRGTWIGAFFVVAGILTWTYTDRPIVIWAVLGLEGVAFAVWSWPWLARLRELPRLGSAWLGIAYWLLGIVGAVLVGHLNVAAQRVAYAGVFTLAVLAVLACRRGTGARTGDPSIGIAAAMIGGIAILLLAGSGTLFDTVHQVPANGAAQLMKDRFWGGLGLFFQPNSMAGLAIAAAIRIGPDRAFAAWQRVAVTALTGFVLFLTNSRIGFVFAAFVALLHAVLLLRRRHHDLPTWRRPWLAVLAPFAVLAVVLAFSGGQKFLTQSRFSAAAPPTTATVSAPPRADLTSGRIATWKQVATDWRHASWAEKLFGDADTSRAVVIRTSNGAPVTASTPKLNTDNAAVGAFRRGGVLGALAFVGGLLLLLWRVFRRRDGELPPAWFTILAIGVLPTIATEDWLLGGTNGGIWILLLAGEAGLLATTSAKAAMSRAKAAPVSPAAVTAPTDVPSGRPVAAPAALLSRRGAQ